MIKEEYIKVGLKFSIDNTNLHTLVDKSVGIASLPRYEVYTIKSVEDGYCVCVLEGTEREYNIANSTIKEQGEEIVVTSREEQVSHPSHYKWLKDLCGVEPIDICRHLDFNIGCAVKYLLRKGKREMNLSDKEQRIQDLKKAVFYIQDEIKMLSDGKWL